MIKRVQSNNQVTPVERNKPDYPVSFSTQQGYWLINNLRESKPEQHQLLLYKITGTINIQLLTASILDTIGRHEIFHTAFRLHGEEPVLSINPTETAVQQINLENYTKEQQDEKISGITAEYFEAPFNLQEGNLIRTALIKLKDDECLLLLVQHIIIVDNDSAAIFLRDLLGYYNAKMENREPALPPLPVQYLDYAVWRTRILQAKLLDREIPYWKKTLEGAPPFLPLATDYPRLSVFKKKKRNIPYHFQSPSELNKKLKPVIQQLGVSLAAFFLGIYKIFLYHYSSRTDILIGTPYSIRNRLELQDLIGCFINTLIIRTQIDTNQSFAGFLKQVTSNSMSAYAHGNLPLEKIIDIINPERNIFYKPLIQVLFDFEYAQKKPEKSDPDLKIERLLFVAEELNYDLHLSMLGDIDGNIDIYFLYNENLFKADTIAGMAKYFMSLAGSVIADPHKKICSLKTVAEKEAANRTIPVNNIPQTQAGDICRAIPASIEKSLIAMFSQIFTTAEIGSHSNFIKLGGHSLAAARLIAKIKNDYNIEMDFQSVFEAQTVSHLAELIADKLAEK